MLIIFEGHDLSGKTSIAQELSKRLEGSIYVKNNHQPFGDTEAERYKLKRSYDTVIDLFKVMNYEMPRSHMVLDRFFLSELVYSEVLRNNPQIQDPYYNRLNKRVKSLDTLLVLVQAPEADIIKRRAKRGEDRLINSQITQAKETYLKYLTITDFKNKLVLDNPEGEFETNISKILNLIQNER